MSLDANTNYLPYKQYPHCNIPNIKYRINKEMAAIEAKSGREIKEPFIDIQMVEWIERLAKKHHNWLFLGEMRNPFQTEHKHFYVYEKNELLGELFLGRVGSGAAFFVQSWRIDHHTNRKWTRNVDKAMKLVTENMYRRTREEVAVSVHANVLNAINRTVDKYESAIQEIVGWDFNASKSKALVREALKFADSMSDEFRNSLSPEMKEAYTKFKTDSEAFRITRDLRDAMRNHEGNLIMVMGNGDYDYYNPEGINKVWRVSADEMRRFTWDSQCIGMLKLVEDNHFIEGMGYRLNETAYYIMKEPK